MALTHTAVAKAKPQDKVYKLSDRDNLYLLVRLLVQNRGSMTTA